MKKTFVFMFLCAMALGLNLIAADQPTISILGDSYSTFEQYIPKGNAVWYFNAPKNKNDVTKVEETWWHQAIKLLDGKLEKNESYSGSTICNTGYGKKDSSRTSFITRMDRLGNPNIILVCGATNDSWAGSPIGEYKYSDWTKEDLATFRPAMAKLCDGLKQLYPDAKIYFILNSELSNAINDSVHTICKHYNIPCIDLRNIGKQKGHPDIAGMKAMAEQVAEAVKNSVK